MTDYTKLVEDLRDIEKTMFALGTSPINMDNVSIRLAYDKRWGPTANDAAAAIEALLKENKELIEDHPEMVEADGHWEWRKPNGEAQLPKRGEWIEENRRPRSSQFVCSECHRTAYDPQPTRDKAWKKRCRYAYCPNCGAKMEVQDNPQLTKTVPVGESLKADERKVQAIKSVTMREGDTDTDGFMRKAVEAVMEVQDENHE